jgi:hypothetical protein
MDKLLLFLNSAYLGLGAFFSFYVAPTLFKVLEKTEAGKVVERVFPCLFLFRYSGHAYLHPFGLGDLAEAFSF